MIVKWSFEKGQAHQKKKERERKNKKGNSQHFEAERQNDN
jgi:hypothetical protein